MTTTIWTGNAGQTHADPDNWDNGLPSEGDDAIYPPDSAIVNTPVGGIDYTGLNELEAPIRSITVAAGATYNIGTSMSPMKVPLGLLVHEGSGTVRLTHVPANPPVASCRVIVRSSNFNDAVIVGTDGENIAQLVCMSGKVIGSGSISAAYVIPVIQRRAILELTSGNAESHNAGGELIIKANAAPSLVTQRNGTMEVDGRPVSVTIFGGFVDWRSTQALDGVERDVALLGGTLTTENVIGARFRSLSISPLAQYYEGNGVGYGQPGLSYIADNDPIGA